MKIHGCGLGFRDSFFDTIFDYENRIDFIEVVPENHMHADKSERKALKRICETFPTVAHGLSLSLGAVGELEREHLYELKKFLDRYKIEIYSEHLSFTSLEGVQSYELLPLPMTEEMVKAVVKKIEIIQEILERPLIIENPTYYTVLSSTMEEPEFISAILEESGARLLLDINNVYVNSFNHNFNPYRFIDALDLDHVAYCHIAGHLEYRDDLFIDTHGMPVKEEVWQLMRYLRKKKLLPVLLERDNNIPPLADLMMEFERMRRICDETGA
ncbi:DUF692 domain-containing protein [Nitratifractor sp.]